MNTIILKPFFHRGQKCIGFFFKYDTVIKEHIKLLKGLRWSSHFSTFYLTDTLENRNLMMEHLKKGHFDFDSSAFQQKNADKLNLNKKLPDDRQRVMEDYVSYLRGKRYSRNTIKTYQNFIHKFLEYYRKPIMEIDNRGFELYIEKVIAAKNYSISSHRQCVSAFIHFAKMLVLPDLDIERLQRPRKSKMLPVILSSQEIIDILVATRNLKHRAILALIYSSGLRIGELLHLRLHQIDLDRRQLRIVQAKGRKDRYVGLAESCIPLLKNYLNTYKPRSLFVEGADGGTYSSSSVRSVLKESCRRAGIRKKVSPHSLRHAYATHMLENGIGLRYIQALLGHSRPETTMIYTQVTQMDMVQVKSPLDVAVAKLRKDNHDENLRLSRNTIV